MTVLLGLVDLYLKEGKPIGSNTLKSAGFKFLSSATIRNYFAKLESEGYLHQQHSSGGRIPTNKAYKFYVDTYILDREPILKEEKLLSKTLQKETNEVVSYLHSAAETLSELTQCPVFLSTPRFDVDFIQNIRFMPLDSEKLLCILVTNFGLLRTETLLLPRSFTQEEAGELEHYFHWRLSKKPKPLFSDEKLSKWAQRIYNEIMVRHVTNSAQSSTEIYRTGLSKLLLYPEFTDPSALASSLSLFEDSLQMRSLLNTSLLKNKLSCWIGDDLGPKTSECCVISIPYKIGQINAGSFAVLGPCRLPYRWLFSVLDHFASLVSDAITENVYKFKIHFHPPQDEALLKKNLSEAQLILLEDKSRKK
jgi:heat-inducible transcriptional repressor